MLAHRNDQALSENSPWPGKLISRRALAHGCCNRRNKAGRQRVPADLRGEGSLAGCSYDSPRFSAW